MRKAADLAEALRTLAGLSRLGQAAAIAGVDALTEAARQRVRAEVQRTGVGKSLAATAELIDGAASAIEQLRAAVRAYQRVDAPPGRPRNGPETARPAPQARTWRGYPPRAR